MSQVKAYLHVVYAGFGDASMLELRSDGKRRLYLVDGGPVRHIGAGGTQEKRIKILTKSQLSRPYYQYLLKTLTGLARIPNSTGIKLDGVVVTHPHADHLNGVERLFRELLPLQYQESVMSERPEKRLMCNGPVLLTRKFSQEDKAYRSFSDFLLTAKFEISLDNEDILNAFGNDIAFAFPSSPGVLYQRQKPSKDDEPFSEEKQRSKLKGGTEDDDLNKSSIIMYTQKGGKIFLSGDAYGHDIVAMLRKEGVKDLDIFKLPHHGSANNSILGKVLPPPWAFQNLAAMLLLSISLTKKISFEGSPEEDSNIDSLRQNLEIIAGDGNGEELQRIAEAFLKELRARGKNETQQITPDELLKNIKEKHLQIVEGLQQQSGEIDPCENLRPLKHLEDWAALRNKVANTLVFYRTPDSTKARKVSMSPLVGTVMGDDPIYQDYFAGKIGIDGFFQSFHSKTYYVSADGKYRHPSSDVIKGIIKAAVEKNKSCRIVFTSGGALPAKYLPDSQHKHYKEWNKLVSLYYLKSNVLFTLDPSNNANVAPSGTAKFESEEKVRIDVAAQLKKNFGFTIPQRSFLPTLDQYYVKTKISDSKFLWLKVDSDGTLFLTSTKGNQNVLMVSNAPSINGDLRMLTLKSMSENGGVKNVWLEKKKKKKGFLLKGTAEGDYLFEENGALKSGNENKGSFFFFEHKTFSGQMNSGNEVSIVQFLKSFGYDGDDNSVNVRSVLEVLLGMPNVKRLIEELPDDFIGIATLDHKVNLNLSKVELSSSVDCEVVSSHIEVMVSTTSVMFDRHKVTKLEVVVKDPCASSPNLLLLISNSLRNTRYTVDLSGHLKPREPSVDMYLNVLGGVPLEGRSNMTLGTLLERVMGLLPLENLSKCLQTQLLAREMFTWKVDRGLSTVNYFISPLTVEVLSGDMYVNIPPGMNSMTFGDTVTVHLSRMHVIVSDPRTIKSSFVIECDAKIGSNPVNMKMAPTSTGVPELTIAFPESVKVAALFKTLGVPSILLEVSVPLANEVIKNLQLSKPRISVVQDVASSNVTRISRVTFDFSFDMFPSVLPSSLPLPQDSKASLSIFNPFSGKLQVGVEVEFNLPVSSSANHSFLISKLSLWPVELSDQETLASHRFTISLWPSSSAISIQSVLQAVGLGELTESMTESFPRISSVLTNIQLEKVTLESNIQSRAIDSFTLSLSVPEFSIIEEKLSMHGAKFYLQHCGDQWYAETEMKLLVFNKFVCHAAFSFPRPDVPGLLTFQNTETLFTLKELVAGIGAAVPDDLPVIEGVLDVKISEVSISLENGVDGASFKLTKMVTVLEKRTLTVGPLKLYNLKLDVCYANITQQSSVSFSLQGYLNPKTHASLVFDAEQRKLLGRYVFTANISSSDCLNELFHDEMNDFSSDNAFDQVKSLHVQEVKVALSFPYEKDWGLTEFVLSMEGTLSLGPFNLKRLRLHYVKDQADEAKQHISVVGQFKSDDQLLSFTMELSCTGQQSKDTAFEAAIKPDSPRGVTLSSLLQLIGLKNPEVPQVDGSPDFLDIELKEAFLRFEASPFRIRKVDVVIQTTETLTILEKPLIQLHEVRLEYHLDDTNDSSETQIFIAGGFTLATLRLDITLRKNDGNRGLTLEGRLQGTQNTDNLDFEQAAKQLSPNVPFSLPKNVTLSWFLFKLDRNEEAVSLELEGESHTNWSIDAGFGIITVENLGGKLKFEKHRTSDAWTCFVCLTGEVLLPGSVAAVVDVYYDSKGDTLVRGTVREPEKFDLQVMTQKFGASSDSSKSWNRLVPQETESSVRSPKFNSASLLINCSRKSLLFYGHVAGFGSGLLILTKTDGDEESPEYGFLFGLSLGRDFKFASLNRSLSVVDEILSLQQANLSVISMDHVTVEEMCKDFSKLQEIGLKQQEVDVPFSGLDIQAISKLQVKPGVTAFAKMAFSGGESKLLSNVTQIQRGQELADIVLFAHIAVKGMDTIFKAEIKEIKLFGGSLRFQEITLTYQPSEGKTFTLTGKMSLVLTDDSNPIVFQGSLKISESEAQFSMTVGDTPRNIHEPFGMFGITFDDPQLQLSWRFGQDEHSFIVPFCAISGTVNFSQSSSGGEKQPGITLKGSILFQEGKPVVASVAFDLNHPLSIDDMFATLFKEHWPSGYLDISFKEGEIYYAKAEVEVDKKTYQEGFHGQTEIEIFGNAFGVEVSVDQKGLTVKGYTKFDIDLIIATFTCKTFEDNKGPEIEITRYDGKTKFELTTGVTLLQEKIGTCSVEYDVQQKCFLGGVTYHGELLGVSHPSVDFEWSQETGFKIRKWPMILDLQELIDFARVFEELSQMINSPCEKLVGLVFDKVIKTKCRLDVKQVSVKDTEKPDAWFALKLEGKLDIMIVTEKPSVTVDFPEMVLAVTKPPKQFRLSDLPGFLISEIAKNSLILVKQVFTQPKHLMEFMAALGTIKLSRKVLSGLICRGAHSPNITEQAEAELDSMEEEAVSSEEALETDFEKLIETAGKAVNIAEIAASAVSVITQVSVVVGALVAIISFIAGIISFFTGKSKEQKEAEQRLKEAKRKEEKARKLVEDRLVIVDLSIALTKGNEVEVSWKPLEENVKYRITLKQIDLGGLETVLSDATTENNRVNVKSEAVKYNSKQFMAFVQASFLCGGESFRGNEQSISKVVTPLLRAPSKVEVESKQKGREINVIFSQVEYAVDYKAEVITNDGSVIGGAIKKRPPGNKDGIHVFHTQELDSGIPGETKVRVCARGHDQKVNEFKYSSGLYLVAAPSNIRHSYEELSQQLAVKWKVNDTHNISSYLCEIQAVETYAVVFTKEVLKSTGDCVEANLKIPLNDVSDKCKSPYRIRICSLGVSATLASPFVNSNSYLSFLPQVGGITHSYEPQSNQLTVSWVTVTGATKYKVAISEDSNISNVVGNLTSEGDTNKVAFDMGKVRLKIGVEYVVTVIAEGSDALHLPGLPSASDIKFSQLPKPASVSQEYSFEERKVKVNFQPVFLASAHLIEFFDEKTTTNIASRYVVSKPIDRDDWPPTVMHSFDVENMRLTGGDRFKSRVTALGSSNWTNSPSCVSVTALKCSEGPISVTLKYSTETSNLMIILSSRPGHFAAKVEDTFHKSRTISTQQFVAQQSTGRESADQTVFTIPLVSDEEPRGAIYQAFVQNNGDQQHLPSEVKSSNQVPLLNPPDSVKQEYKDNIFTVAWKPVNLAVGYNIKVYNTKTGNTASAVSVIPDSGSTEVQMKKEFDVDSLKLESSGLYETLVTVVGDELSVGGASTKATTTIPSSPSPEDVRIAFNQETGRVVVHCSSVTDTLVLRLGVADADKLKNQEVDIQGAILGFKDVANQLVPCDSSSGGARTEEAEFDDSVLITSLNALHRGVAQVKERQREISLPSGYSISEDVLPWLRPAVPIHMSFDPVNTTVKVTWTQVSLALKYSVEILQERENNGRRIALIPFSEEIPGDVLSFTFSMEKVNIEENDTFIAKVHPWGRPGTVITLQATGYSNETLTCEDSPTDVEVSQVEDETVKVTWKVQAVSMFQLSIWKILESGDQEHVISKQTYKPLMISTSQALRMVSPGRYKVGVRAQGSINKLHSVYKDADFKAVILNAPIVISLRQRPAVTVKWTPVDNNPTQDFSNYVISYLQRGTKPQWTQVEVEISATEKTIVDLEPDSEYLFCISVASSKRGNGIRSPVTAVHTDLDTRLPRNLLDNPNFAPEDGWEEQGYTYNIVTHPWKLIQPTDKQYRLEHSTVLDTKLPGNFLDNPNFASAEGLEEQSWQLIRPTDKQHKLEHSTALGVGDNWRNFDRNNAWCIAAPGHVRNSCWRFQIINLLDKGFTAEYLDEVRPDIDVCEWFGIDKGGSGTFDMKVSLLDNDEKDLPGNHVFLARSIKDPLKDGYWKCLAHTFKKYPPGLRFIRFEDGMQSLGLGGHAYDIKAFGAKVSVKKSPSNYSKECEAAVNEQINLELHASYVFLSMSCYKYHDVVVDDLTQPGFNDFVLIQSNLCVSHAKMLMKYQRESGGKIELRDIKRPERDTWGTRLEACEAALQLAKNIDDSLLALHRVARKNGDHHMMRFISDNLLKKQAESVIELSSFVTKLKKAGEGYDKLDSKVLGTE